MSETVPIALQPYRNWFSFKVKRQRLNYFIANVLLGFGSFTIVMVLSALLPGGSFVLLALLSVAWWVIQVLLSSQRLRDIQVSQWWLVPLYLSQATYFLIPFGVLLPIAAVSFLTFWPGENDRDTTGKYVSALPVICVLLFLTLSETPHDKCLKRLQQSDVVYLDPDYICTLELLAEKASSRDVND